jgi:hypothetical protein
MQFWQASHDFNALSAQNCHKNHCAEGAEGSPEHVRAHPVRRVAQPAPRETDPSAPSLVNYVFSL